jgi:hypothetical protein
MIIIINDSSAALYCNKLFTDILSLPALYANALFALNDRLIKKYRLMAAGRKSKSKSIKSSSRTEAGN